MHPDSYNKPSPPAWTTAMFHFQPGPPVDWTGLDFLSKTVSTFCVQLAPLLGQEETDKLDNKLRSLNVTGDNKTIFNGK